LSGAVVFQQALRLLRQLDLPEQAERDLLSCMEAAKPGPLDFAYLAGLDAGLERDDLLLRSAAIFFNFAAGNLADDLADGDCDYLELRAAPSAQFMLQNLCVLAAATSGAGVVALAEFAAELVRAAGPQQIEVRTSRWTLAQARRVGEGIVGRQYAAHLRLLWAGSTLELKAEELGLALGIATHVAEDLRTADPRVTSLPLEEREQLIAWGSQAATRLDGTGLRSIDAARAALRCTYESG